MKYLRRVNKNGAESSRKNPQKVIQYVCKSKKWETTKGYKLTDKQGRSTPSFVLGSSEVPLPCGAQGRVQSKTTHQHQARRMDIVYINILGLI